MQNGMPKYFGLNQKQLFTIEFHLLIHVQKVYAFQNEIGFSKH